MSSKYPAPSPWSWDRWVDLVAGNRSRVLMDVNGQPILRHEALTWEVSDANAALVATAPELLEALRDLVASVDRHADWCDKRNMDSSASPSEETLDAARAAIAKAGGGDDPA